jgi:FkbM family methyltransferase
MGSAELLSTGTYERERNDSNSYLDQTVERLSGKDVRASSVEWPVLPHERCGPSRGLAQGSLARGPNSETHLRRLDGWTRRAGPLRLATMTTTSHALRSRTDRLVRGLRHWQRAPEMVACAIRIHQWRRVILAYLGLQNLRYPFTINFRNGDRIRVETHHDLVTVWVVFFRNEYQVDTECRTIVDAGANIGTFVLYAARKAPQSSIHALEPFPSTYQRLLETLRLNDLEQRVTVYPIGLSGDDSTRFMPEVGPSQSRGTRTDGVGVPVTTQTLEHFLDSAGIPNADLLKMDIEGGEHEVFSATRVETLKRLRRIALEYHPNGSSNVLFAKLQRAGFVCQHDARFFENSGVAYFTLAD